MKFSINNRKDYMRLAEILLEYRRDITAQRMGDKLVATGKKEGIEYLPDILEILEGMDPTKNKQYVEWVCRQWINGQFRLEDGPRVLEILTKFIESKNRVQSKDIGRYDFRTLRDEIRQLYSGVQSDADVNNVAGAYPIIPNTEVLYNGPLGQLSIPKTEKASCELGKNTEWCTAWKKDNRFGDYNNEGPLYVWIDKNGEKYQFHFGKHLQAMDKNDDPIGRSKFNYFRNKHPVVGKIIRQNEKSMLKTPIGTIRYRKIIDGDWPEGDTAISELYKKMANILQDKFIDGDEYRKYMKYWGYSKEEMVEALNEVSYLIDALEYGDIEKAGNIIQYHENLQYINSTLKYWLGVSLSEILDDDYDDGFLV